MQKAITILTVTAVLIWIVAMMMLLLIPETSEYRKSFKRPGEVTSFCNVQVPFKCETLAVEPQNGSRENLQPTRHPVYILDGTALQNGTGGTCDEC